MGWIIVVLLSIVLFVLLTFGIKNYEMMIEHFYIQFSSIPIPVYVVVYGSLIVGIFIGMLVGISTRFAQRKKLKALQKENRNLKAKVAKAPEEKAVLEAVVEEKETLPEQTEEVKTEFEPKEEPGEEDEEEEEEEEKKETRF